MDTRIWCLLSVVLLTLLSCTTYHMEYPQPVDSKNLYQFPASFRGVWSEDKGNNGKFTIRIDKDKLILMPFEEFPPMYKGVLDSTGKKNHEGLQHSDQKHPYDTVDDFIVKGNRIYSWLEYDKKKFLSPGMEYVLKNDSLYIRPAETNPFTLTLSTENFLRKISRDTYMLNLSEGSFISNLMGMSGGWWQMVVIEKMPDGQLLISDPEFNSLATENEKIDCNSSDCYLNIRWTRKDICTMMEKKEFIGEPMHRLRKQK